jgi:hypothetical protein
VSTGSIEMPVAVCMALYVSAKRSAQRRNG